MRRRGVGAHRAGFQRLGRNGAASGSYMGAHEAHQTEFPSVFMTLAPIGKNRPRGLLGRLLGRWRATGRFTEKLGLVKNRDSRRRFTSALVVLIAA